MNILFQRYFIGLTQFFGSFSLSMKKLFKVEINDPLKYYLHPAFNL